MVAYVDLIWGLIVPALYKRSCITPSAVWIEETEQMGQKQ